MKKRTITHEFAESLRIGKNLVIGLIISLILLFIFFVCINYFEFSTLKNIQTSVNFICVCFILFILTLIGFQFYKLSTDRDKLFELRKEERDLIIKFFYEKKKSEIEHLQEVLDSFKKIVKESDIKTIDDEFDLFTNKIVIPLKAFCKLDEIDIEIIKINDANSKINKASQLDLKPIIRRHKEAVEYLKEIVQKCEIGAKETKELLNNRISRTNKTKASVEILIEKVEEQNSLKHMLAELDG